jgi:hypothetical protein
MDSFLVLTEFDEKTLVERLKAGKPPTIGIHIQVGDVSFPSDTWDDFSCVLEWWIRAVRDLPICPERKCKLRFMDGPYEVSIQYSPDATCKVALIQSGLKRQVISVGRCLYAEVRDSIIQAGSRLYHAMTELRATDRDFHALGDALASCERGPK